MLLDEVLSVTKEEFYTLLGDYPKAHHSIFSDEPDRDSMVDFKECFRKMTGDLFFQEVANSNVFR